MSDERAVSLLALAIAFVATLALFFGNFTVAYLLQALRGERVRAAGLLVSLLLTLLPLAALLWGGRLWWRVQRARSAAREEPSPPTARTRRPRPQVGPAPMVGAVSTPERPDPTGREIEAVERERLLELARWRRGFDIREAMAESRLRPNELTYLLDAMIAEGALEVEATEGGLRYRIAAEERPRGEDDGATP